MSQNQQETLMSKGASDSLAAEMPRVPGAETAKSIIENAVHPHHDTPATAATVQAEPGDATQAYPAAGAAVAAQRPVGTTATTESFVDQVIEISIMGEALTFSKRAMVTEEVRLSKRPFTEQKSVTDTVRRERVTVEGADVVEGADAQIDARGGAGSSQGARGPAQDTVREGAGHTHEGGANVKQGFDGMIDGAVDRLFGGHHQ
jgi:hypothetical protein